MNVIRAIVGLILIALMILLLVNIKSVLPYFDNLALGGGSASPLQIGSDYINQINGIYPSAGGYKGGAGAITYGDFKTQTGAYTQASQSTSGTTQKTQARVSVEKAGNLIALTTENLAIPTAMQGQLHIWIANTPAISDTTTYVDLGIVASGGIQTYKKDIGNAPFSFREYKYIMIVNPADFSIYSESVLHV